MVHIVIGCDNAAVSLKNELVEFLKSQGAEVEDIGVAAASDDLREGLAAFADEKAAVFSRGMMQRLSLARLFLLEPVLILLDEPGTGLDAASAALVRAELAAAGARGAALVWVTHSLAEDLPLADEVVVLRGGLGETHAKDAFDLAAYQRDMAECAQRAGNSL